MSPARWKDNLVDNLKYGLDYANEYSGVAFDVESCRQLEPFLRMYIGEEVVDKLPGSKVIL